MTSQTRTSKARSGRTWPVHLILGIGALAMVMPFLWELLTSLKSRGESVRTPPTFWPSWQWSNYTEVFDAIPLDRKSVV